MATFEDIMRGRVDLSRLEEQRGWLGQARRDPVEEHLNMAQRLLPPLPKEAKP